MTKPSTKFPGLTVTTQRVPTGTGYPDRLTFVCYFTFGPIQRVYEVTPGFVCLLSPGRLKMRADMVIYCEAYAQAVADKLRAEAA